jgi:hypothetical protein
LNKNSPFDSRIGYLKPTNLASLCEAKLDLIEELEVEFKNKGGTHIFGSTQ